MESDMVVVLGLALMFFGGVIYLIYKDRASEKSSTAEHGIASQHDAVPFKKGKQR